MPAALNIAEITAFTLSISSGDAFPPQLMSAATLFPCRKSWNIAVAPDGAVYTCTGTSGTSLILEISKRISSGDGKLHRLSFSKSLLKHIASLTGESYTLARFRIVRGRQLNPNETSTTGLYGIETHKGFMLRIAMTPEVANFLCDWKWRKLCEVSLEPCSMNSKTEKMKRAA